MATFTITSATLMTISDNTTSSQSLTMLGIAGNILDVSVTLTGLSTSFSSSLDMLLRAPASAGNLMFWSDAGAGAVIAGQNFTIGDTAATDLPSGTGLASGGSFRPTSYDDTESATDFGSPPGGLHFAGTGGANGFANNFGGASPNGAWTLSVRDDDGFNDTGSLNGWSLTVTSSNNNVVIDGTAGDDALVVHLDSGLGTSGTYSLNGGPAIAFTGIDSLTFNGGAGDDTMTLDLDGNFFILPATGYTFNGGTQGANGDRLILTDGSLSDQTFNFTNATSGNIAFGEGGPLTFTGVETMQDTLTGLNLTLNMPGSTDTIFLEDDGTAGNAIAQLRSGTGTFPTLTFHVPDSNLTLTPGPDDTVNIDMTEALSGASFNVGTLFTPFQAATINVGHVEADRVSLAAFGNINEWGDDPDADIVAYDLGLSVSTAGSIGGPDTLETEVSRLEAEVTGGDIDIANLKQVDIGGSSPTLSGLVVHGNGNIHVTSLGQMILEDTTSGVTVTGGDTGNVRLEAIGYDASVLGYAVKAVEAAGGDVFISAGADIDLGDGVGGNADIRANGSVTLQAGRDVFLRNGTDVAADSYSNSTGGSISIASGRNLDFTGSSTVSSETGAITALTGAGGLLNANATGAVFRTFNGAVTLIADRMSLASGGSLAVEQVSGISTNPITLQTFTAGRAIRLGSLNDASGLELSQTELNLLGGRSVVIGSAAAGTVTIVGAVSDFTGTDDVTIRTGSSILVNAAFGESGTLGLFAGGNIAISAAGQLSAGSLSASVDSPDTDAGTGASFTNAGTLGSAALTGNGDNDALNGGDSGDQLTGNGGNDTLSARGGDDILDGGAGNDSLTGGTGSDQLTGGANNDTLDGGGEADTLTGGDGNDTYNNPGAATIVEGSGGASGTDTVNSNATHTLADNVERLFLTGTATINGTGNGLANQINGNTANNALSGLVGNDTLTGAAGGDTLNGGAGLDRLTGGTQRDKLIPGVDSDRDTLVFSILNDSTGVTRDVIDRIDFNNEDKIDLPVVPTAIAAAITTGTLSTATFNANLAAAVNAAALPAGQAVLFDPNAGNLDQAGMVYLVVDANGIAGYQANADWVFQLENVNTTFLDPTDFI